MRTVTLLFYAVALFLLAVIADALGGPRMIADALGTSDPDAVRRVEGVFAIAFVVILPAAFVVLAILDTLASRDAED